MTPDEEHHEELEGESPAEESNRLWQELVVKAAEMVVHFGLFNAVVEQYPDHVRENLNDEMRGILQKLDDEIDFVQNFAEGFD